MGLNSYGNNIRMMNEAAAAAVAKTEEKQINA